MTQSPDRIRVIFDTDTNNELDDQHALAYLMFSGATFEPEGVTVNATYRGGDVDEHYLEAERILRLCTLEDRIPLLKGANGSFNEIRSHIHESDFDGFEAVDFIIHRSLAESDRKLVLLAVGKLTNIALAFLKQPEIADHTQVLWLGSNYPAPGEYNQDNDEAALNFLLDSHADFSIAPVRYGDLSATHAVRASREDIRKRMPGCGPRADEPVVGRHGGTFSTFGDYSVDLFENISLKPDLPSRALYDMAAVAILKNPDWATPRRLPAPLLVGGQWVERPENQRTIRIWEYFDSAAIMDDFYQTMVAFELCGTQGR
jgi:inosine-uridine nucleoside N-ribohydrolase